MRDARISDLGEGIKHRDLHIKRQSHFRQALADAVGVHYQTIGYLERGEYSPSLTLALRLAEVLGRSVQDLFSVRPFDVER